MAVTSDNSAHSSSEFWTVVTDFILSAACAVFARRLQDRIHSVSAKKQCKAFLVMFE